MFDAHTKRTIIDTAARLDLAPTILLAVAEVESGGVAFAEVDGRKEPLIRFEGHYFDRRLSAGNRRRARAAGLSSPVAGAVKNPKSQAERWRLLRQAAEIDPQAACESASWGLGQVMGAHWRWLGYRSVDELVEEARNGVDGQIRLMVRYIEKAGLVEPLRRRDWKAFARGYNGPAYARRGYHLRLEAAFRNHAAATRPVAGPNGAAGGPARREANRDLQLMLSAAGYPVAVDGFIGRETVSAIRRFQTDHGLEVDGIAGSNTLAALHGAAPPPVSGTARGAP